MVDMGNIIIAGTESVFGLSQIKEAFSSLGFRVRFAEAPFMRKYIAPHGSEPVDYSADFAGNDVVVPLSEFWISWCIKTGRCCISQTALRASRSKKFLYETLAAAGADSVRSFSGIDEAFSELENGVKIVVKPEGLYSGLGIIVVDPPHRDMLGTYVQQAQAIHTKNMKLMEIENGPCMLTEYISGAEYSADCFFFRGRISLVRVCRKKIVLINKKPCAAVYQLVKPDQKITQCLELWMNAMFEQDNISFGQFDFIITDDGSRIVPIDFAARVGGGLTELLSETGTNPYADAVRGECRVYDGGKVFTQFNYLPVKNGYITNDNYNLAEGHQYVFKHTGDYVISFPSSVGSRIALVIQQRDSEALPDNVPDSLLVDGRWIT